MSEDSGMSQSVCRHEDSLYGRCAACGMTWKQQEQEQERDRRAEKWLTARHTPEWYIGSASSDEWAAAYAAIDASVTLANEELRS